MARRPGNRAAAPAPEVAASMAYDAAAHTIVLFGGYGSDGIFAGDTWSWDRSTWSWGNSG